MVKNVLLLSPPYHTGIIEVTGTWPPLSLVYLAGHLRHAGFQPEIYDAMSKQVTLEDVAAKICAVKPDAVLIGAFTPSVNSALEVLKLTRAIDPNILTLLGGVHATFCYAEILRQHKYVDFIIRGEGEETLVQLLSYLSGHGSPGDDALEQIPGIAWRRNGDAAVTAEREFASSLDDLIPAWDLLDWSDYRYQVTGRRLGLVGSSRGCPYHCRFCSQHLFWRGTYRERSAESFVAEVEHLHTTYGIGMFMLADEYATQNRVRWERILDLLVEKNLNVHFSLETRVSDIVRDQDILRKYRKAGVIHVYCGVETTDQATLDWYRKGVTIDQGRTAIALLNKAGIISECSFILGNPGETVDSINRTLSLAMEYSPDLAHFLLITPWPYTPLYQELLPHIIEHDYSKYHFVHPIVKPTGMSVELVWEKLIECFKTFYRAKAGRCPEIADDFKREYMFKCMDIMQQQFFAANFGPDTIRPAALKEYPHEGKGKTSSG